MQLQPSAAPNGSLLQQERHTTDAPQSETCPFPLGVSPTFSPPPPPQPRLHPPGRHHWCRAHNSVHEAGVKVTHPPPKRGIHRATFAAAAASPPPPSHVHGRVLGPTMSCCPIRRTCSFASGAFWVGWLLGGGFAGEVLRGLGGLNSQVDSRSPR